MHSILIRNPVIITQNASREVKRGDILVEGNRIKIVGHAKGSADEEIDASSMVALPGLINTHAHVAMAHMKGLLDDLTLESFLEKTFKLDAERTEKGIYNSALVGSLEMIDSGVTSYHDLYYSEDVIARASEEAGIRGFLSWNTLDPEFTTQKGSPVENADRFISEHHGRSLITPSIGVQGIYVSSDENYAAVREVAEKRKTTIHTHLAETRGEVYDFVRKNKGKRPVEHLSSIGFLGSNLICAHSAFVNMREVRLLAKSGTRVSWNAISNSKLGTGGQPPIPEMLDNHVVVSLGTDSNGSNNSLSILECMKFSSLMVKNNRWDPTLLNAQTMLDMATVDAARSLGTSEIGSIEQGKLADLILLDSRDPNLVPLSLANAINMVVYSANPSNIDTVLIDGKVVKRNKSLTVEKPAFQYEDMV